MYTRTETDAVTGEVVVINQKAYQLTGGEYALLDADSTPPEGAVEVEAIPPSAPQVPQVVTMRQARLALHAAGLLSQVDAAIDSLQEPQRTEARIEWDFSSTVEREKPFVAMIGQSLGLSSEDTDALFIQAAAL